MDAGNVRMGSADGVVMENFLDHASPLPASGPSHLHTLGRKVRLRNPRIQNLDAQQVAATTARWQRRAN